VTRTAWRLPALLVLGALVMQAAWILALPPFRGADEFDHAYRATPGRPRAAVDWSRRPVT
jgi:hypothetical protein